MRSLNCCFFFFNDTATTEIYTLSLHDALPICSIAERVRSASCSSDGGACSSAFSIGCRYVWLARDRRTDRKSTRLNSSHTVISYAVFCLKKKKGYEGIVYLGSRE